MLPNYDEMQPIIVNDDYTEQLNTAIVSSIAVDPFCFVEREKPTTC